MANSTIGTYSIEDLQSVKNASVLDFGMDKIYRALQQDLDFYNKQVNEQMGLFCEITTDSARKYGVSRTHRMTELDELGKTQTKKAVGSSDVFFPLRKYGASVGWSHDYMGLASPAELTQEFLAVQAGNSYEMTQQIKKAIFTKENGSSIDPKTQTTLSIKRFVNADSAAIPDFEGVSFSASEHTHYSGSATLSSTAVQNTVDNITEHGHTQGLMIMISKSDASDFSVLTGFQPLASNLMIYNATDVTKEMIDNTDLNNRFIGYFNSIPVWIKQYVPANYLLAIALDGEKPLAFRQFPSPAMQGLRMVSNNPAYPLITSQFENWFGIGVNERTKGACLYFANATYTSPTIV